MPTSRLALAAYGAATLLSLTLTLSGGHARAQARAVVVQRGDALSLIALRFNVTVEDLRRWNQLDSDRILAGQEIRLAPSDDAAASAASSSTTREAPTEAHSNSAEHADADDDQTGEADGDEEDGDDADARDDEADVEEADASEAADSAQGVDAEPEDPDHMTHHPFAPHPPLTYRVRRGDTLSGIAVSQGTTLERLRAINTLRRDRIREGQTLNVPAPDAPLRDHVVRRGESLGSIAQRFEVRPRDIVRWNAGLRPARLTPGQHLRIYSELRDSRSESIGKPSRGTLAHAERLLPDPGYVIHEPSRAYGTLETTQWLTEAVDAVREEHPGAPRIAVHDLSAPHGGRLRGHRSHQSGRDADLSYYQIRCGGRPCLFHRVDPAQLDHARQWALLRHWLERDEVEYVFMDYDLQRSLYAYARSHGATRAQLSRWFQFPRGRRHRLGIIRHFRGHRDHLHVRFACPDTDEDCR